MQTQYHGRTNFEVFVVCAQLLGRLHEGHVSRQKDTRCHTRGMRDNEGRGGIFLRGEEEGSGADVHRAGALDAQDQRLALLIEIMISP